MTGFVISPLMMGLIEDAKFEWELSEDGLRFDVGYGLWDLHDRWIMNTDGSVDQFKKNERAHGYTHRAWFSSWAYAEKWMAQEVGFSARRGPIIMVSDYEEDLHPRCTLMDNSPTTGLLVDGELAAKMSHSNACYASHFLTESLEDIVASYRHPEGKPLYGIDPIPLPGDRP